MTNTPKSKQVFNKDDQKNKNNKNEHKKNKNEEDALVDRYFNSTPEEMRRAGYNKRLLEVCASTLTNMDE